MDLHQLLVSTERSCGSTSAPSLPAIPINRRTAHTGTTIRQRRTTETHPPVIPARACEEGRERDAMDPPRTAALHPRVAPTRAAAGATAAAADHGHHCAAVGTTLRDRGWVEASDDLPSKRASRTFNARLNRTSQSCMGRTSRAGNNRESPFQGPQFNRIPTQKEY